VSPLPALLAYNEGHEPLESHPLSPFVSGTLSAENIHSVNWKMQTKSHWEEIYHTKPADQVSWYQEHSQVSLNIIKRTGVTPQGNIIDVGGGASTLVDDLLAEGFGNLTVLDISGAALRVAQHRMGGRAKAVTWLEADITRVTLPTHHFDVWHDRAVFHFLTRQTDRAQYIETVRSAVKPGGHVIVATFGLDGPLRCSGLNVVRYSPDGLHDEFGRSFELVEHTEEVHHTPFGTEQQFIYCYCRKP
jgi:SAM-dependent methyltransferase